MNFLRTTIVKVASFSCVLAVSSFIWLTTLNLTILNPEITKGWLRQSNVYSKIIPTFTKSATEEQLPNNNLISAEHTQQALTNTFNPVYVQVQSEKALDSVYAWLDGKIKEPTFSIPINEKKDDFIKQLSIAIEPQVAALPICTTQPAMSARSIPCRPPITTSEEFAKLVVTESVNQNQLLDKPLTQEELGAIEPVSGTPEDPNEPPINQLPTAVGLLRWLLIALPIIVLLCIGLLTVAAGDKLTAFMRLCRRIFLGSILTLLSAGILAYLSLNPHLIPGFNMAPTGGAAEIFAPALQLAINDIAGHLALLSGVTSIASGGGWLLFYLLLKRRQDKLSLT